MRLSAKLINIDCQNARELAEWWATALEAEIGRDFGSFVTVNSDPLPFGFQEVPESKQVKNRLHIDFIGGERNEAVERLLGLGAKFVADFDENGYRWTTLEDPEGNEFCVGDPIKKK